MNPGQWRQGIEMVREQIPVQHDVFVWARERRGLTLDDAARRADIPVTTLVAIERGEREPTAAQIRRAAETYIVSPAVFFLPQAPPVGFGLRMNDELPDNADFLSMSTVRELHVQAMRFSQDASVARAAGELDLALALTRAALPFERMAAQKIAKSIDSEPTRSILYRSAAALAYKADCLDEALQLAAEGLSGWPPPSVKEELLDLIERIHLASYREVEDRSGDSRSQDNCH